MCVSGHSNTTVHTPFLLRGRTVSLEDTENLVSGDEADLGDTVRVTENDTDLRRGETALGELEDLVGNVLGSGLGPRGLGATVWQRGAADTLSGRVHAVGQCVCGQNGGGQGYRIGRLR